MNISLATRQPSPVTRQKHWFPLTVLIVGVGALVLFATSELIRERFVAGVTLIQAIDKVQTKVAEFVTGDINDQMAIRQSIEESTQLLNYLEIETRENRWLLNNVEQTKGLAALTSASEELKRFSALSQQRSTGFHSESDARLDAAFSRMFVALRQLSELYDAALERNDRHSSLLVSTIIVAWSIFICATAVILWRRERRRFETETVLQETESRLNQSQKMDAVGRLAGGIAHDINNHLAAITMQCEIVKLKAAKGDPTIERMNAITGIGAKSTELIRRLLAFSRKQPIQPELVQLKTVVPELEKMLTRLIGDDVQLNIQCQGDLWNVLIDPSQLDQILLNLIINARDAMPRGGEIKVLIENRTVTTIDIEKNGDLPCGEYVVISVGDQGSGIPSAILDKIYEPFFTTKKLGTNSGLGLATVHGIVKQNKGHIELDTEQNVGTTFRISLPRSENNVPAPIPKQVANVQRHSNEGTCILLVEDNKELRKGTSEILIELGYAVICACDGRQALRIFEEHQADLNLIITDVVMPKLGGKEVADTLRKRRPDIPIIFMSGYTDDIVLRHGVAAGDVNFVPKPFSAADLAKKVNDVLTGYCHA